jgi:hypothetical protein
VPCWSGLLHKNQPDYRGYVLPCLLIYIGDGTEKNILFKGEDVIGISIWETRCHQRRKDLIIYCPRNGKVYRICLDDKENKTGCGAFLKMRVCNVGYVIPNMVQVMK